MLSRANKTAFDFSCDDVLEKWKGVHLFNIRGWTLLGMAEAMASRENPTPCFEMQMERLLFKMNFGMKVD